MKFIYLLFALYLILGNYGTILAQYSSEPPKIEKDVCPYEGCKLGQWTSRETIKVYTKEGDTISIKYLLSENDTLTAFNGNVHYERFGKVLVTRSFGNYNANDTITILRCTEGEYIGYHKGKKIYVDMFWPYDEEDGFSEQYNDSVHYGIMIEKPEMIWWVKISSNGTEGWLCLKNLTLYCFRIKERIDGMDVFE
jgi:hypothetical protein